MIYLISDGDFQGLTGGSRYTSADGKELRGNEAMLQWLRDNNPKQLGKGRVRICTFLFGEADEGAVKLMKTIAEESGGWYKRISFDE